MDGGLASENNGCSGNSKRPIYGLLDVCDSASEDERRNMHIGIIVIVTL